MTAANKIRQVIEHIKNAWWWLRFAVAMSITFLVLIYVPWVLAGWGWAAPMAQGALQIKITMALAAAGCWYVFVFMFCGGLGYICLANAADALSMTIKYIERQQRGY